MSSGVSFRYVVPPGLNAQTQWSDTLLRADASPCLGPNYYINQTQFSTSSGPNLDTNVNVNNTFGATFSGPLLAPETWFVPVPINWARVVQLAPTRGMFGQMTLTQIVAGISGAVGIGLFLQNQAANGYALTCQSPTGNWNLQQFGVGLIRGAAINTVVNDVARLEMRLTTPTNMELKCFKNGVLASTDNLNPLTNSSPTTGVFGIYYAGGNGSTLSFKNFSAGLL